MRLGLDNLNTHTGASWYEAFPPQEARRWLDRLEIQHTPKHASWLNRAELASGVLPSQCLNRRLDNADGLRSAIRAWEERRNQPQVKIHWSFTLAVARHKLKKLYPVIDHSTLDVRFISSLPVKRQSFCTAWADKRLAQVVGDES